MQTRQRKTEAGYRKRYTGMIRTLCRRQKVVSVNVEDLAAEVGRRASRLTPNSLKQYHAVLRQQLRDLWDQGAIAEEEVERIDAMLRMQRPMPETSKDKAGRRTSARRAKSVRPETLSALVSELLSDPTAIRRIAAAQLEYGVVIATRPSEFLTLNVDANDRLWVTSAKYSEANRRGLQPERSVALDHLDPGDIVELREIAGLLLAERKAGATTASLLRRCQNAIRVARTEVGGRSKTVTAYTVRHQARANMAAMEMTPEEVAVMMNHASATTAQSHYAPARQGWKGLKGIAPPAVDPVLVAKVRPGNRSRGWTIEPPPGRRPG